MDLPFDKKKHFQERLEFVRFYARWVKSVDNKVWSSQQAKFINSLMANAKNFQLSKEKYLAMIEKGSRFRGKRRLLQNRI
jgi:hypothetical protein